MSPNPNFPEGFFWGASTSAHQVEGNNHNDWTEWEPIHAQGKPDPQNYISGRAVDHYNRFKEDFSLAKELHFNACRLSLEWSRIEPQEGVINQEAVAHYREVLATMRENGLEPFVTLWHWTEPIWFRDQGGWLSPKAVSHYLRHVENCVSLFGEQVRWWITLNEPEVYVSNAYVLGHRPPQLRKPWLYPYLVIRLTNAHRQAYAVIKAAYPQAHVGVAKDAYWFDPSPNFFSRLAARVANWFRSHWFYDRIQKYQDFIGINYYLRYLVNGIHFSAQGPLDSVPRLGPLAASLYQRYQRPVVITENGLPDQEDTTRQAYLPLAVKTLADAIDQGAQIIGYLHWSLLDNFEWEYGFGPRFGLIGIDYQHDLTRTIRPSARWLGKVAEHNGLQDT